MKRSVHAAQQMLTHLLCKPYEGICLLFCPTPDLAPTFTLALSSEAKVLLQAAFEAAYIQDIRARSGSAGACDTPLHLGSWVDNMTRLA